MERTATVGILAKKDRNFQNSDEKTRINVQDFRDVIQTLREIHPSHHYSSSWAIWLTIVLYKNKSNELQLANKINNQAKALVLVKLSSISACSPSKRQLVSKSHLFYIRQQLHSLASSLSSRQIELIKRFDKHYVLRAMQQQKTSWIKFASIGMSIIDILWN